MPVASGWVGNGPRRASIPRAETHGWISGAGERVRRRCSGRRRTRGRSRGSWCSRWCCSTGGWRRSRDGADGAWPWNVRRRTMWWNGTSWCCGVVLSGAPGSRDGRSAARPIDVSLRAGRERGLDALTGSSLQTGYSGSMGAIDSSRQPYDRRPESRGRRGVGRAPPTIDRVRPSPSHATLPGDRMIHVSSPKLG